MTIDLHTRFAVKQALISKGVVQEHNAEQFLDNHYVTVIKPSWFRRLLVKMLGFFTDFEDNEVTILLIEKD